LIFVKRLINNSILLKALQYILTFIFISLTVSVFPQVDKLKPVELHPPRPPKPFEQKESKEQLAAQYFRNREFEKAVVLYEELYENGRNRNFYTYYVYCLVELQEFRKAEKLIKSQQKKYPEQLKYMVDMGNIYERQGELNKAKKQYESAIKKLSPNRSRIIDLANAFMVIGKTDYAVRTYHRGRQIMDGYPFYYELGNLYRQTRNYSQMISEYLDFVEYEPNNMATTQHLLQSVLDKDPEQEISNNLRKSLLIRIQKYPEKVYYSEMLLWLSIQDKDFEQAFRQAKAIDRRLNELGHRVFELANLSLVNKNYDVAIEAYTYIVEKGKNGFYYFDSKVGLLNARYLKITTTINYSEEDLVDLEDDFKSTLDEYGTNATTLPVMRYLGHIQAFYLDKTPEAIEVLYRAIEIPSASEVDIAECKIELADILLFSGEVWEATLLYSQVSKAFKNDPTGHLAKYKNAKLSYYIGEFEWAKTQLKVLKAATSKLIANDALQLSLLINDNIDMDSSTVALSLYSRADLLLYRNKDELALTTLDSIFELGLYHPIYDETLYKKAQIKIKQHKYNEAVEYLNDIVQNYSYDITADDALFMLAELYNWKLDDKDKAMELYKQLMIDYTGSLYTTEARKRFRSLRGDFDGLENESEEIFFYDMQFQDN
jgi:tetratricopeptide (TPR) repeat protein